MKIGQLVKTSLVTLVALVGAANSATSYTQNGDHIKSVINAESGLFFKSEISCPSNWCQVPPGWPEEKRRLAAAMLMASKLNGVGVNLYWGFAKNPTSDVVPSGSIVGTIELE